MINETLIYDSLDNAVKELISGSYLDNSEHQYSPAIALFESPDNSAWPKIITSTSTGYIEGDVVGVNLVVSILFKPTDLEFCKTKIEKDNRIIKEADFHKRVLIEIYWWMTGKLKLSGTRAETFRDYNTDGRARFNTFYSKEGLSDDQRQLIDDDVVIVSITIPLRDNYNNLCCPTLTN